MKTHIRIMAVSNGYIVSEGGDKYGNCGVMNEEHVFETFDNLTKWLSQNLEDPFKQRGRAITATEARDGGLQ